MPAFSKMLQHHGLTLERFRSALAKHLPFLRSTKGGDATISLDFSHVQNPRLHSVAETIQEGPYSQIEADLPFPTVQPGHELGQVQNTQRSDGRGWKKDAPDSNTHEV